MRNTSTTQLIIGTAVAVGMSVIAVSAVGGAIAQSPVKPTQVIGQEALTNRSTPPISETEFRLSDNVYFLDGRFW
jgi:hypothetical protein